MLPQSPWTRPLEPAAAHTLYEWGLELARIRIERGLSRQDVVRLIGLGEACTAATITRCEFGYGTHQELAEITEALGLGVRVEIVDAEDLAEEFVGIEAFRQRLREQRSLELVPD